MKTSDRKHWEKCRLPKDHEGGCRMYPLCSCNTCRNDVRSPLPGCLKHRLDDEPKNEKR